ncbi:MAG: hypothetical protein ACI85K_002375 [Hyphomicrobiaceae bacterium]|jgi:hypothetical protein
MPPMHKLAAALLSLTACIAQDHGGKPASSKPAGKAAPELGTVTWERDFDRALERAATTKRPVFLLFQEVPGCDTCTGFGKNVLSHPLLKDAIEHQFVPIVVRNNVKGTEEEIRERYNEPSWNNPVVRFVDAKGLDILPRKDRVWDAHGIATRMIATLKKNQQSVPGYLAIAAAETAPKTEKAVFEMHCYWEGEAHLGALDGVIKTTSAWVGKAEVVEVLYRPEVISKTKLTEAAQAKSCKPVTAETVRVAKASDQQHSLGGTPYAKLKLSPMQRTKMHADISQQRDPKRWLSPSQTTALSKLQPPK